MSRTGFFVSLILIITCLVVGGDLTNGGKVVNQTNQTNSSAPGLNEIGKDPAEFPPSPTTASSSSSPTSSSSSSPATRTTTKSSTTANLPDPGYKTITATGVQQSGDQNKTSDEQSKTGGNVTASLGPRSSSVGVEYSTSSLPTTTTTTTTTTGQKYDPSDVFFDDPDAGTPGISKESELLEDGSNNTKKLDGFQGEREEEEEEDNNKNILGDANEVFMKRPEDDDNDDDYKDDGGLGDSSEFEGGDSEADDALVKQESIADDNQDKAKVATKSPASNHFMTTIVILIILVALLYIVYHNRQKVMAYVIEGRHRRPARRRTNVSVDYKKLPTGEETLSQPDDGNSSKSYIY